MSKILLTLLLIMTSLIVARGQRTSAPSPRTTSTRTAATPTADQVIDRYLVALGGKAALTKVNSIVKKGEVRVEGVQGKGTIEEYSKAPNFTMVRMMLPLLGFRHFGFDGRNLWRLEPPKGYVDVGGAEYDVVAHGSEFRSELMFRKLYPKVEMRGVQTVNGRDAYVLIGTPTRLSPEKFYFDKETGLLVRHDATYPAATGPISSESYYEDYREVDGVKHPFLTRERLNNELVIVTRYLYMKHNVPIDDSTFRKPVSR